MTDLELLNQYLQDRSPHALGQIVQRHVDLVYATALRETGDHHLAEDITQAVFLVFVRRAASLSASVILGGWFFQAAMYAAADARKLAARRQFHELKASQMETSDTHNPESATANVELGAQIHRAISRLSANDRDVVVLRYLHGMSTHDVAETLGTTELVARKRLSRAVDRLRKYLARRGNLLAVGLLLVALESLKAQATPAIVAQQVQSAALRQSATNPLSRTLADRLYQHSGRSRIPTGAIAAILIAAAFLTAVAVGLKLGKPPAASGPVAAQPAAPAPALAKASSEAQLAIAQNVPGTPAAPSTPALDTSSSPALASAPPNVAPLPDPLNPIRPTAGVPASPIAPADAPFDTTVVFDPLGAPQLVAPATRPAPRADSPNMPAILEAPFTPQAAAARQAQWSDVLKTPTTITNTLGMKFTLIPPGTFTMGTSAAETPRGSNEGPPRQVTLTTPFYMGLHHVTVAEFRQFVQATGYTTQAQQGDGAILWDGTTLKKDPKGNWQNVGFPQGDDHPVLCVSWNDARAFCQWLGKKEDVTYRLPTEAQWEYCCRAGTETDYPWTAIAPRIDATPRANTADLAFKEKSPTAETFPWRDGFVYTSPVGSYRPNSFGLFDMIGNAAQWCDDWYVNRYPDNDRADPPGPSTGTERVLRGSAWNSAPASSRSGFRYWAAPDYRSDLIGFRIVRELKNSGGGNP